MNNFQALNLQSLIETAKIANTKQVSTTCYNSELKLFTCHFNTKEEALTFISGIYGHEAFNSTVHIVVEELKQTKQGTWFIAATADDVIVKIATDLGYVPVVQ